MRVSGRAPLRKWYQVPLIALTASTSSDDPLLPPLRGGGAHERTHRRCSLGAAQLETGEHGGNDV